MDITKKGRVYNKKFPPQVEWILKKLRDSGYEAFAVGGCVRDTILNRIPGDWDITTSAKPVEVKAVFGKNSGHRASARDCHGDPGSRGL